MTTRRLAPYAIAITGAIWLVNDIGSVSGLSAFYILFVLWLGARWGRGPAVVGSVAAFLLYDFYFVPPVGTFTVTRATARSTTSSSSSAGPRTVKVLLAV